MLQEWVSDFPQIHDLFSSVSEHVGYDVWQLVQQGPESRLNQTEYTQVAMLVADVALFSVIQKQQELSPMMMAGHSLGEYAALVCAGSIDLTDAAKLVSQRGRLMQQSIPLGLGAMAAIVGLTDEQVNHVCVQASSDAHIVTPANYNAIGQVVIAGHTSAVERALSIAENQGARLAKMIPVSVPCHCPLLSETAILFFEALQSYQFKTPKCPVISNVDLSIYQTDQQIKQLLTQQLYSPVRWVETIQMMKNKGINRLVECGPGKVLSGLVKRIDKSLSVVSAEEQYRLTRILT